MDAAIFLDVAPCILYVSDLFTLLAYSDRQIDPVYFGVINAFDFHPPELLLHELNNFG
jgi:hypothetical protein